MAKIHFVRHGRTVLNELRRTQGAADSPLTPEGRKGVEVCRDHLAQTPLTRAYLSPQGRVQETASILLEPHPEVVPVNLIGLREYNYGIYDGGPDPEMHAALPTEEHLPPVLTGTHPGAPEGIHARDYLADIDGAIARVVADLRAAAAQGAAHDGEEVLVVSHGMTIMTIMSRWIGLEVYGWAPMANCAITSVEVDPTAPDGSPTLIRWAYDPADQGVTFPSKDITSAFEGIVPVPIDWEHPEGL
ncbi:histidine phosphatase family protein [Actinomyces howellii]|uniref:Phosphoglycerate mutase n=1 Tax=Actinomyces howellii TaxID=52771 RepID=A0A448HE32_9ACTO|nr:histidine phosphatase family protein [Actinomyces howellii]VEG25813.1 phosphoglycerate mutase [Actinomyces howellii]